VDAGGKIMKHLVEFEIEGGGSILVEVDEPLPQTGTRRVTRNGATIEKASQSFQQALGTIKPAVDALTARLNDLNDPNEVAVEFGLKLSAKAGVVLASVDSEVAFKVSLKWQNKQERDE
jgi:hypothetical protein